jgi:hypothetical protein
MDCGLTSSPTSSESFRGYSGLQAGKETECPGERGRDSRFAVPAKSVSGGRPVSRVVVRVFYPLWMVAGRYRFYPTPSRPRC